MRKEWSWLFLSVLLAATLSGCGGAIKNISIGILASYDPVALDRPVSTWSMPPRSAAPW